MGVIQHFIYSRRNLIAVATGLGLSLSACVAPPAPPQVVQAPQPVVAAVAPPLVKTYKRKIAIGRFTNETLYGKALLTGDQIDPLGKQTTDMLSARLVESGRFLVFERPDINLAHNEQALSGIQGNIIGVDTLIVGSLTEFGRSIEGENGFLSGTKKQTARAKVEIRLVDVKTGHAFFSATGAGQASVEAGNVMGFGNQAGYDSTLNDRAIGAAISDLLGRLVTKLEERPWKSDILKVDGSRIYLSGGERQGVKVGDALKVMRATETVRSAQSGFDIDLPPTEVAQMTVEGQFGTDETNEGSIARITGGAVPASGREKLFVVDGRAR
ncbi:MAG: curli production assembly protein CsgG [Rhodospirillales bacterium]|nr:curli production assembly protein CsgG [Rhodospirillales bacterium]